MCMENKENRMEQEKFKDVISTEVKSQPSFLQSMNGITELSHLGETFPLLPPGFWTHVFTSKNTVAYSGYCFKANTAPRWIVSPACSHLELALQPYLGEVVSLLY